jgi:DNA-binding transcriptional LysR family regulator
MRDPVSPSSAIRRHPGCAERRGSRAAARRAAVLMRQIRSLERDLGANLLERAARNHPVGRRVLTAADRPLKPSRL